MHASSSRKILRYSSSAANGGSTPSQHLSPAGYSSSSSSSGSSSKPVDFFRPLTVDVSVEYELPKEVNPPPGSAPLLIIHPSAYLRNKVSDNLQGSPQSSSSSSSSSRGQNPHSSAYYLRSSVNSAAHHPSHITSSSSHYHVRSRSGSSATGDNRASIIMNCPYGKCDECSSSSSANSNSANNGSRVSSVIKKLGFQNSTPSSSSHQTSAAAVAAANAAAQYYGSPASGVTTRASSNLRSHQIRQHQQLYETSTLSDGLSGILNSTSQGVIDYANAVAATAAAAAAVVVGTPPTAAARTSLTNSSNKRLRMMSQQQQQQNAAAAMAAAAAAAAAAHAAVASTTSSHHHSSQTHLQPFAQPVMEPLNLAVAPANNAVLHSQQQRDRSPASPMVLYQQQNHRSASKGGSSSTKLSTLSHLQQQQQQMHQQKLQLNYASTFPTSQSNNGQMTLQQQHYQQQLHQQYQNSQATGKDAVPVNKGSGSDSGVCSENESDPSPPMSHHHGNGSHHHHSIHGQHHQSVAANHSGYHPNQYGSQANPSSRRSSILASQDFSSSSAGKLEQTYSVYSESQIGHLQSRHSSVYPFNNFYMSSVNSS